MPVIVKRPRARTDLAEIWDYIADDSEARADAFIGTMDQKFHALAGQPNIGRVRDELETSLRSIPVETMQGRLGYPPQFKPKQSEDNYERTNPSDP